jgi:alpha/beta hydrolase fold
MLAPQWIFGFRQSGDRRWRVPAHRDESPCWLLAEVSAGGGMILAVALQLRERGLAAARHTVLISPWLDISLTDPNVAAIAHHL